MTHLRRWREKILENIPSRFTELGFARMHSLNPSSTTVIGGLRMLWMGFCATVFGFAVLRLSESFTPQ